MPCLPARRRVSLAETQHQRNERLIAKWTFVLGLFSVATFVVAGITAVILYRTDETARASNRAFVTASGLRIEPVQGYSGFSVAVLFENSGNSPTVNLKWGGRPLAHSEIVAPESLLKSERGDPIRFPVGEINHSGLIGPKSTVTPYITTLWPTDVADIRAEKIKPIFYGAISYDDIFGKSHKTFYCFTVYSHPTLQGENGPPGYLPCSGQSNCADDECK